MPAPGRYTAVTRAITALVGGALGFLASTALSLLAGSDRETAVKFGAVAGGSTAIAAWVASGDEDPPDPRDDPIRIEIAESPDDGPPSDPQ